MRLARRVRRRCSRNQNPEPHGSRSWDARHESSSAERPRVSSTRRPCSARQSRTPKRSATPCASRRVRALWRGRARRVPRAVRSEPSGFRKAGSRGMGRANGRGGDRWVRRPPCARRARVARLCGCAGLRCAPAQPFQARGAAARHQGVRGAGGAALAAFPTCMKHVWRRPFILRIPVVTPTCSASSRTCCVPRIPRTPRTEIRYHPGPSNRAQHVDHHVP